MTAAGERQADPDEAQKQFPTRILVIADCWLPIFNQRL
jgi:hypothetical protein